jgi:hypothetical protein
MIYITGPGHGGPGLVANAYLEGTYSEVYPNISVDGPPLRSPVIFGLGGSHQLLLECFGQPVLSAWSKLSFHHISWDFAVMKKQPRFGVGQRLGSRCPKIHRQIVPSKRPDRHAFDRA